MKLLSLQKKYASDFLKILLGSVKKNSERIFSGLGNETSNNYLCPVWKGSLPLGYLIVNS